VKGRIDMLRQLKDAVGAFTAFLSVEPLIGPCDQHDYRDIDQVLIGGESGGGAREMSVDLTRCARDLALGAGAAVRLKQFGLWINNPLCRESKASLHIDRVRHAIRRGEREARIVRDPKTGRSKIAGEKGGATLDSKVWHQHPPAVDSIATRLNKRLL
jgi:hypothetical protein